MKKRYEFVNYFPFVMNLINRRVTKQRFLEFLKYLNLFLQDPKLRKEFDLKEKYNYKERLELLKELHFEGYQQLTKKPSFEIEPIDEIPEDMLIKFFRATFHMSQNSQKIQNCEVKYQASYKGKTIGVIAAVNFKEGRVLSVEALYVDEDFRGHGIALKLISEIIKLAKKRKLEGVDFDSMELGTHVLLGKLQKKAQKENLPFTIEFQNDEDYGWCGSLRFK